MGMGFRLDWKSVFPVQSPLPTNTNTSARQHFSSVRGREACFESPRVSILSVTSEESEILNKDSLKACTSSFAALPTIENGYTIMEEMKTNIGKGSQSSLYNTIDDISMPISDDTSTIFAGLQVSKPSHFSLLMKNVEKLEQTYVNSDLVRLERDILVQLGKLGALQLFHACLSRTPKAPTALNLSDSPMELAEGFVQDGTVDNWIGDIIVHSGRKEERKSRRERRSKIAIKTTTLSSSSTTIRRVRPKSTLSTSKSPSNSKTRRHLLARNESEMSRGVKDVANLERIRTILEEDIGQVASFRSWSEAAGVDEEVLQQRLHFGWHCRDKLLKSTRSLVVYLARNYRGLGIAFEDLLQAGRLGVLQGAERFDHTRGYRFSTYVQYWIRKSMSTLVARHSRGIHIPVSLRRAINQILESRRALYNIHGRYPDDDEIAKFTGLSLAKIKLASKCLRVVGSIDQRMGDTTSVKFMELTSDMSMKSPEEAVMRQHMRKDIDDLLQGLHPRERQVLMLRYGLWDGRRKSLEEIGRLFLSTKEWIRKIEMAALTKVRKEEVQRNLNQYLDL